MQNRDYRAGGLQWLHGKFRRLHKDKDGSD